LKRIFIQRFLVTGYIDRLILGTNHIYGNPTAKDVYNTGAFDPEGILGKPR
jgi:heparan-alpha-glucosaminide N-acetyltransferase